MEKKFESQIRQETREWERKHDPNNKGYVLKWDGKWYTKKQLEDRKAAAHKRAEEILKNLGL